MSDGSHEEYKVHCNCHGTHETKIDRNERDIEKEKGRVDKRFDDIWKELDGMKRWVIAGCGSMILALIAVVGQFVLAYTHPPKQQQERVVVITEEHMKQLKAMKTGQ